MLICEVIEKKQKSNKQKQKYRPSSPLPQEHNDLSTAIGINICGRG